MLYLSIYLIGLVLISLYGSFIAGYRLKKNKYHRDPIDYILLGIIWPLAAIGFLLSLPIRLFYWLGQQAGSGDKKTYEHDPY